MRQLGIALVRFYQKHLSHLKRRPTCIYYPTCSSYAVEAFEKRGFLVGLLLTAWRILRCNPLSHGGFDPVPDKGFGRKVRRRDLQKLAKEMRENGEMDWANEYDTPKRIPKYEKKSD